MEQRRLRLGDILDDYCPRERRVTNHAVVAMIEDAVKQTRCTTCDAEHVYKGGAAPRRKKLEGTSKLYKQVLAGLTDPETAAAAPEAASMDESEPDSEAIDAAADVIEDDPLPADEGPVHRPLIRAQLPRIEGLKVERQAPDFTIRQTAGRGPGSFRGGHAHGGGGPRFGRGPNRGGGRGGVNQGFGRGPGGGNQRQSGPRKRSR